MRHHAYLYEGSQSALEPLVDAACKEFSFERENNPDMHVLQFEKFGIDEARELRAQAALKTTSGHALFVVAIASTTSEAQQALLKLFEEPQAGVMFVVLAPHGMALPTLRSRMLAFDVTLTGFEKSPSAVNFLKSTGKARSDQIAALLKDDEGTKERVRDFLNDLEQQLSPYIKDARAREGLADVAHVRSYLGDRSPSLKMLLEHLAVALPQQSS